MSKFTPGPWGSSARQGDDWESVVYQQSNPNLEVCQCFHGSLSLEGKERCEATARLIAAAPELYTELKAAIGNLTMAMLVMDSESRQVALECIQEHKKAIAKAEGRQ